MTPDEARARAERAVCAMVSSSATFAAMAWTTQRLGSVSYTHLTLPTT